MLKIITNEGKTYEEAQTKLLNDSSLTKEDYFIKSEETEAKLFKSKKNHHYSNFKKRCN